VARNATAQFLSRGALWITWEEGHKHFITYLLDGDWSVNAGNWMWLSSSSFERLLDCTECFSPSLYGRRFDPTGAYVKRYVPELADMPVEYVHEPWNAPRHVQEKARCVLGEDYPRPIVDFGVRSRRNSRVSCFLALLNAKRVLFPMLHSHVTS
jgi:cryptochrome